MNTYDENDDSESMYICAVCSKLLDPNWEDWICSSCFMSDAYAYRHAVNPNENPD